LGQALAAFAGLAGASLDNAVDGVRLAGILAVIKETTLISEVLCRAACVAALALTLAGCGPRPEASFRYKLTISVETPEGMKTGSNVVELDYFKSLSGDPHRTYGQALVLDLGASGTLVVMLTQGQRKAWRMPAWEEDDPKGIIFKKCGRDMRKVFDAVDMVRSIADCKAVYPLDPIYPRDPDPSEQPDILLLKNAKDPASAAVVDPYHSEVVLGPGVVIRSMTVQLTDEPLTHGVDDHLPWVSKWWGRIEAPEIFGPGPIPHFIGHYDFVQNGEG
jgi:hypothetical protein